MGYTYNSFLEIMALAFLWSHQSHLILITMVLKIGFSTTLSFHLSKAIQDFSLLCASIPSTEAASLEKKTLHWYQNITEHFPDIFFDNFSRNTMTYRTVTWHMWNMFPSFSPPKSSFTSSTISPNELLWLNFSFHGSFVQIRKTRSRSKFCIQMYFWMNELVKIDDLRRWLMKEGSCKCPVIKVSAHCQTDQSFSDPLSEFSCCNQLKLQFE